MATASSCASGKFPDAHYSLSKERSIPPCSVWCARAFSRQAGESRITIVAPSFTNSPRKDASVCARKRMAGTGWLPRLHRRWRRALRKHESNSDSRISNFETVMTAYVRSLAARFVRRRQTERELEEELGSHIQLRADELERSGCTRAEAKRRARIEFGSPERFKEECREELGGNFIDILMQDVRFSLRMLRKSAGFTAVAVLTIAVGIGATTAIFSVVDAALLHPLPYPQPEQLVSIADDLPGVGAQDVGMSEPEWQDLQRSGIFEYVSPTWYDDNNLTGSSQPARVSLLIVAPDYFAVLGVKPQLGRTFDPKNHNPGFTEEVVISDEL